MGQPANQMQQPVRGLSLPKFGQADNKAKTKIA